MSKDDDRHWKLELEMRRLLEAKTISRSEYLAAMNESNKMRAEAKKRGES